MVRNDGLSSLILLVNHHPFDKIKQISLATTKVTHSLWITDSENKSELMIIGTTQLKLIFCGT